MALRIPLESIPNQTLDVLLSGLRHTITIKEADGIMALTIVRDDVTIIEGQLMPANEPLIPYRYLEAGNFIMRTDGDVIPYYTEFGTSQRFIWLSPEELETYRDDD